MAKEILIALVAGFVIFEFIEHVVFPLVWSIIQRKKGSVCDVSSMVGKVGEVKHWQGNEGKIFIDGELWNARGDFPMLQGDKVVVESLEGFMLTVRRALTDPSNSVRKY